MLSHPASPLPGPLPGPPPGAGGFRGLVRDIAGFAGGRLAWVAALAVLAAAAEGVGLLALVPLLHILGLNELGPGRGFALDGAPVSEGLVGAIGLEGALALYVALVGGGALVVAARGAAVAGLRLDYGDDLRRRLRHALSVMEWRAFHRLKGADAIHALTTEIARASHGVDFLLRAAGWAFEIPVLLAVAWRLSAPMTLAALALALVGLAATRPLDRRAHALGRRFGLANKALQGELADDLAGMRVIRAGGLETQRRQRFATRLAEAREGQRAFHRATGLATAATRILAALAAAAAVWLAVAVRGMALADTLVLLLAFARLLLAASRVQDAWRTVLHSLPAHAATQELLAHCRAHAEPESGPEADAGMTMGVAPTLDRAVTLEAVSLSYDRESPPALDRVDARFPARAVTAIVGPSGAGKSTLADLLLGLTAPDQGRVLIDGQALTPATRRAWRRRVGTVPQDAFLFHDTIRANLTMAAPKASDAQLWDALERAAADDFARALPMGLETVVGDRGGLISGGQRQRLALARALLGEPELLILDEATSGLDHDHERRVLAALTALSARLTVVVIAHRPTTARAADHVVVLEAGRVVASGSWDEVTSAAAPLIERLAMA